ncbi:hypothetical protein [Amycolatopsis sp. NPDC098790]|uniref:hypothetical protein n=1 Tax=Amycolatopsis sp. NPDC098790 TaxID=3363939 RepID=UPI00380C5942
MGLGESTKVLIGVDVGDGLASGAVWSVTTVAVAILIAVFVLHRHLRAHHLRSRIRFDLLPTAMVDPSPHVVLGFVRQLVRVISP